MQRDKEYITKKITDKIDSLHDKKYIKPLLFIKENIDLYNEYELCYLIDFEILFFVLTVGIVKDESSPGQNPHPYPSPFKKFKSFIFHPSSITLQ